MKEYTDKIQAMNIIASGKNGNAYFGTTRKDWEVIDFLKSVPTADVISIPDGATNGNMLMIMFPNLEVEIEGTHITCWIDEHRWFAPDYNWWNAPYKRGSEKE
jgi:hypothetical protein